MDKIVGNIISVRKIFTLVALLSVGVLCAVSDRVTLTLLSPDGELLEQIAAGTPFQLAVTVPDCKNTSARPEIAGLEQFAVRSTGFSMTTVNGAATTKFLYTMVCDKPGTYLVGPARVNLDGHMLQSEQLRVVIGERTVSAQSSHAGASGQHAKPYFLRVQCDKEQVFVGESVRCAVRLYTARDGISVKNISKPALPGFVQREKVQEQSGTEQIDGKTYAYHEWSWYLMPQEAGKKIIPAFCADIEQPHSFHSLFANLSSFMQFPGEHARIYSDACTLMVQPLPAHDGPTPVIGSIAALTMAVDPAVAQEGEGMVLTVRVTGDGDLEALDSFALQHMPEQLKWYDSKQYMAPDMGASASTVSGMGESADQNKKNGAQAITSGNPGQDGVEGRTTASADNGAVRQTKVFEYIVQGLAAGNYEIPAQTCTYFDVNTKTFHTIHAAPVRVTIKTQPGFSPAGSQDSVPTHAGAAAAVGAFLGARSGLPTAGTSGGVATALDTTSALPLNTDGDWFAREKRRLPWWLFGAVVGMLVLLGVVRAGRFLMSRMQNAYAGRNKKKQALKDAHAALQKLVRTKECSGVYQIFMQVFAVLLNTQETEIHDALIEKTLIKSGLTDEQMHAWRLFFSRAAEFSFYAPQIEHAEQEKFFKTAQAWLDLIAVRLENEKP